MREEEFLSGLVARTGCGILFDVNNLYVNTVNLGVDADSFIHGIPAEAVGEYGRYTRQLCATSVSGQP
jgi:uncharacterized protein (UPF0276 family)